MPQCSSTCSSSNELTQHTDIQAAVYVQNINMEVALRQITASRAALDVLWGPIRAELYALSCALECYQRAYEAFEMLAIATSR